MARDDSSLYTGTTSASFKTRQLERKEDKQEKRAKLLPSAEIVFNAIKSEMDGVMMVTSVDIGKDPQVLMVDLLARQKYVIYLKGLQNKLDIILREHK